MNGKSFKMSNIKDFIDFHAERAGMTREEYTAYYLSEKKETDVYNYTDYSNTTLKSDIDQKWKALSDMTYDLEQWIEASYRANGEEAIEGIEDSLEGLLKWIKKTKRSR